MAVTLTLCPCIQGANNNYIGPKDFPFITGIFERINNR